MQDLCLNKICIHKTNIEKALKVTQGTYILIILAQMFQLMAIK